MDDPIDEVEFEEAVEDDEPILEEEEELDLTEQQRAEAADLFKLYRQHPEIWIPYSEQVVKQLNTRGPTDQPGTTIVNPTLNLRNVDHVDPTHKTYPFLTNYERTKCISFRASQISNGAKPYMVVPLGVTDSYEIAKMELENKRLPYIIKRPIPDGSFEVWRLGDLMIM
jgi:DNA-directed RNA polymerase I, II, and III subunit RPABC2